MPQSTSKKPSGAAYQASPAQCFKADGQNFGRGQNFAQKRAKNQKCQGAEIGLK